MTVQTPALWGGAMKNVVYQAKVQVKNSQKFETYTGLTYRKFCTRLKEHSDDMKDPAKRTSSKLAGHVWDLKDRGIAFDISWNILTNLMLWAETFFQSSLEIFLWAS